MLYNMCCFFLIFFIYSVIGYVAEVISCSLIEKKLVLNRGYLIGPYIPIYGFGSILMIISLGKYKNDLVVLFVMSMLICSLLEYFTSLIMEKIFKLRWWDYSNKKYNINGRVCLENGVLFGLGGVLVMKALNPAITTLIYQVPSIVTIIIGIILFIVFLIDFVESTYILFRLKINVKKYTNKDATRAIKKEVINSIHKNTTLTSRLINAFPGLNHTANKRFVDLKEKIDKAKKDRKKYRQKIKREKKNKK